MTNSPQNSASVQTMSIRMRLFVGLTGMLFWGLAVAAPTVYLHTLDYHVNWLGWLIVALPAGVLCLAVAMPTPVLLLFAYPVSLCLPLVTVPNLASAALHPLGASLLTSASLAFYVATCLFSLEKSGVQLAKASQQRLEPETGPRPERHPTASFVLLSLLAVVFFLFVTYAVNFHPPTVRSIRLMLPTHPRLPLVALNLVFFLVWLVACRRYFLRSFQRRYVGRLPKRPVQPKTALWSRQTPKLLLVVNAVMAAIWLLLLFLWGQRG